MKTPVIFLAFANNAVNPLTQLTEEDEIVYNALVEGVNESSYIIHRDSHTSLKDMSKNLLDFADQVVLFHYAGHAGSEKLLLEGKDAQASGVAKLLGTQKELKLVFLNGCSTRAQVAYLHQQGIPAVIATDVPVNDHSAKEFAREFYAALWKGRNLQSAFSHASAFRLANSNQESRIYRGDFKLSSSSKKLPWGLYCQGDEILNWTLPRKELIKENIELNYVPFINPEKDLLGRKEVLARCSRVMDEAPKPLLISGFAGVGKTTLAKAYAQKSKNRFRHMVWIEQAGDLISAFTMDMVLLEKLEIPYEEKGLSEDRFRRIVLKLHNFKGPNLLIIDHANEEIARSETLKWLLSSSDWEILVTSRYQLPGFEIIQLPHLEEEAAAALFRKFYSAKIEENELRQLLEYIGYHPLTVELLAKTLENHFGAMTIGDLYQQLVNRQLDEEEFQRVVSVGHSGEEVQIFQYLLQSFSMVEFEDAEVAILKQMVLLPPVPVSFSKLVELLAVPEEQKKEFSTTLQQLVKKGAVERITGTFDFFLQRMMREIIFYQLKPSVEESAPLITNIATLLNYDDDSGNLVETFKWLPYGEFMVNLFPESEHKEQNTLRNNLGLAYQNIGQFDKSIDILEKAMAIDYKILSPDDEGLAVQQSNLALGYQELGLYEKAAKLMEKALNSDISNFGTDSARVAKRQSNLAGIYLDMGRHEEAAGMFGDAVQKLLVHYPAGDPVVSTARSNLAVAFTELGKNEEAIDILEQVLESDVDTFGPEHLNTATKMYNLANAYLGVGQIEKALELFEESLDINRIQLGEDHPAVVDGEASLGVTFSVMGEKDKGIDILEKCLVAYTKHLGKAHPKVEDCRNFIKTIKE